MSCCWGAAPSVCAFRRCAALLTPDPGDRARRALVAVRALHQAGTRDAALALLAVAEAGPADALTRARTCLLRGQLAFASGQSTDGPALLLDAARRFAALDARQARDAYLDALSAAMYAGRLADRTGLKEVAMAASEAPVAPCEDHPADLLLDRLTGLVADRHDTGTPSVKRCGWVVVTCCRRRGARRGVGRWRGCVGCGRVLGCWRRRVRVLGAVRPVVRCIRCR